MLHSRIAVAILMLSNFLPINVHGDESVACGRRLVTREALIVGGHDSRDGDWPWHAIVQHYDTNVNDFVYKCGGTLLNSQSVLTAAHCVYENDHPIISDRVSIQLGRISRKTSGHNQDLQSAVFAIFPHESYDATILSNDIAIIRLATVATLNDYVQPICLWDSSRKDLSEVVGKVGTIIGFGVTEADKISYSLREAAIEVVSRDTCLKSDPDFYKDKLSDNVFCAGLQNGTTACNGDSGGSFTILENGVYRIRGIVSLTKVRGGSERRLCKVDQYVVFTDVAKYLDWIGKFIPSTSIALSIIIAPSTVNGYKNCRFTRNDLANVKTGRDDCPKRCAVTPKCTHFTWTLDGGGTCWMHRNKVSDKDAQAANDPSDSCGIVDNLSNIEWNENDWTFGCEFRGNNLANADTSDVECYTTCNATRGCTHFTWKNGTCWMKKGHMAKNEATVSNDNSTICGITRKIVWNEKNMADGCFFHANDLKVVESATSEDCYRQCMDDYECTHFNWNANNKGTCYMRQVYGVNKNDAVFTSEMSVCGIIS